MSFRPCIVIPVYNHGEALAGTVARLQRHGLPLLLVDDGSDAATQMALAGLAAAEPSIRLFRLPHNQGKGAAVMRGLREAHAAGFSHALQIDADGQHDADDVPKFLEKGRARPEAVICGQALFDASVPKGRLYGRYITHFWVWLETLSFAIADSLCGYRLYPLDATVALMEAEPIPTRMDFDTEILVRLFWRGTPVENLPTRVVYPPGGLSHFDLLRDNLRITWMHTRLCCGMLLRLPRLLGRQIPPSPPLSESLSDSASRRLSRGEQDGGKPPFASPPTRATTSASPLIRGAGGVEGPGEEPSHWSRQAERGTSLGLAILAATRRWLGDRAARALLCFIVAWFYLTGAAARRASLDYLRRLHAYTGGASPAPSQASVYRHMLAFGAAALDKLAAWTGRLGLERLDFPDAAGFGRLVADGRGALLIGAHLGNLEMTRALSSRATSATVNAVVYSRHSRRFTRLLEKASERYGVNLIQVSSFGPDTAILFQEKIERGELLVIVGDRTPPAENGRVSLVDFLGAPAAFAQGPYILAALLGCPVYLFFCLREGEGYRIHFEPFAEAVQLPRKQREAALADYAQRYARRLEAYCARAPLQWFNFFDFWKTA